MTQDMWILLLLKIVLIAGIASNVIFIAVYTGLARWWTNPIGRTIIVEAALLVMAFIPSTLSLFFNFSRLSSHIAAWADIVIFGAISPVMLWRCVVWTRIHRSRATGTLPAGGPDDTPPGELATGEAG